MSNVSFLKSNFNRVRALIEILANSPEDGLQIFCDGVEIEQVLVNLVNNSIAVKDSPGEKWVKIKAFDDNGEVVVQVMDSGVGLSVDLEAKLFQPFFTTKPIGEGTGLGLSIAKGILDQHGASIAVNRQVSNTCFEIRFPISTTAQDVA